MKAPTVLSRRLGLQQRSAGAAVPAGWPPRAAGAGDLDPAPLVCRVMEPAGRSTPEPGDPVQRFAPGIAGTCENGGHQVGFPPGHDPGEGEQSGNVVAPAAPDPPGAPPDRAPPPPGPRGHRVAAPAHVTGPGQHILAHPAMPKTARAAGSQITTARPQDTTARTAARPIRRPH